MDKIELKPCPFCGGKAQRVVYYDLLMVRRAVKCTICGSQIAPTYDEETAIALWNRRYNETERSN